MAGESPTPAKGGAGFAFALIPLTEGWREAPGWLLLLSRAPTFQRFMPALVEVRATTGRPYDSTQPQLPRDRRGDLRSPAYGSILMRKIFFEV